MPDDLGSLVRYLAELYPEETTCPLLTHKHVFRENDFATLARQDIYPFRFEQTLGQVVFIPAGCVHQVCDPFSYKA